MGEHENWIRIVDREGVLSLEAEGPYVRYGWPLSVTIHRRGAGYRVERTEYGDGMSLPPRSASDVDRAGLERFLDSLLADGRPVTRR